MNLRPAQDKLLPTDLKQKIEEEVKNKAKEENKEEDVEMTLEEFIYGNVDSL